MGETASTGPCGSKHIHFVVKSEIDPKPLEIRGKRSSGRSEGLNDPSPFLNDRFLEIGAFKRGCDDITGKILVSTHYQTKLMSMSPLF